MTQERKQVLLDKLETYKKWFTMLFVPSVTLAVGYLSMQVKSDVMIDVKKDYVSHVEYLPVTTKILELDVNQKNLIVKASENKESIALLKQNLETLTKMLEEVRVDVKDINKSLKNQ